MSDFAVERLGDGLYTMRGAIVRSKEVWLTAQQLRDLYDYALLHMTEIEKEATKMNRRIELRKRR
jgi:hypothetical protein